MNEQDLREPVRLYTPASRDQTLAFLRLVDHLFVPPLSSDLRHGSLAAYLEYSLADGQGRVLIYEREPRIIGFLAYRYERSDEFRPGESIYLSNMCVSESLMGTVLMRLFRAMIRQVEVDGFGEAKRIWAKTWRQNIASARTLGRVGLEHVRTLASDPAFGGCRDTLVFEGTWAAFVRSVRELCAASRC
jgi:RimJ/RimL family protein N-acetyltransferase